MKKAVCLMGPTAAGKTDFAVSLCRRFPFEIISVDSAMIYRGMDIGTAKPGAEVLRRTPHRLIDIRDPEESYSAGDFVGDALREMDDILAAGRIPLLVGGTMMYFRALTTGIADLPSADAAVRSRIDEEAEKRGWPALHAELAAIDPAAAARINPNDSQRIQRALEVWRSTGKPLSEWLAADRPDSKSAWRFARIALLPATRKVLHQRIEERLNIMINNDFLEEVRTLFARPGLTERHPSMRCVGYRQLWAYLAGDTGFDEARLRALYATRQLAKRQITWLRSDAELQVFDPLESATIDAISGCLIEFFGA